MKRIILRSSGGRFNPTYVAGTFGIGAKIQLLGDFSARLTKDLVGKPVEVRVPFRALAVDGQRLPNPKGLGSFC